MIDGAFDEEHGHPGPRQYVLIAVVLCVLTAIEVGLLLPRRRRQRQPAHRDAVGARGREVLPRLLRGTCTCGWTRRSSGASSSSASASAPRRVRRRAAHVREHGAAVREVARGRPTFPSPRSSRIPRCGCSSGCSARRTRSRSSGSVRGSRRPKTAVVTPLAGRVLLVRAARAAGRVRLADPRPRRGLPVLGAHGAAPRVLDHRRAAAAARHADVDGALRCSRRRGCCASVRWLARFLPATILFNLVVIVTHIPVVVDAALHNGLIHFALHALVFCSSLIVWMPLAEPAAGGAAPRSRCCGCCSCSCRRSCRRSPRRS